MNSIISWVGGKRLMRKEIIPMLTPHNLYCEVFGGAAWVLFGKSSEKATWGCGARDPYTEVYNDINGELVNFWRQVKAHPEALKLELEKELISREIFDEYLRGEKRTELERAVRFYYLLGCGYGSQSSNFNVMKGARYLPLRTNERIREAAERLRNVIIEQQDWRAIMKRYDGARSLFYLDPPYYEKERLYRRDGAESFGEHQEMAAALKRISGKFVLSYNAVPEVLAMYEGWSRIREVEATYSVAGVQTKSMELIITNYDPE